MVFSSQLRQFPQMIIALDNFMVYVYVITKLYDVIICCYGDIVYQNIGSISSKKIPGVEKLL